jgi:hypothetical protein
MTPAPPSIPELPAPAAPAAPAGAAVGATSGTPAFDVILMLQNLAATPECLDPHLGEPPDLFAAEEAGDEEENAEELEASLAFLAQLLTVTTSRKGPHDFEGGGQSSGDSPEGHEPVLPTKVAEIALPAVVNDASRDEKREGEVILAAVRAEPLESRTAGDASQNLARAAEILSSSPAVRSGTDVEKSTMTTPARDPRWADELGTRISLMVRARESTASLQLTPVDLGPVEVNVTVKDSQATVHFGASQAETRALLEAAMPRLREMLAAQGFQLMDSSVSSGFARSSQQDASPGTDPMGEAETSITEARALRAVGLVDVYA